LLANFLVMAGVQFGRNAFAVADGKRHYPNEFVLLVGESGAGGRKGTATERTLPIFHRVDEHFYDHILNGPVYGRRTHQSNRAADLRRRFSVSVVSRGAVGIRQPDRRDEARGQHHERSSA
jgi:hypothetical protein